MNVTDVVNRVLRKFGDEASVQITQDDIIRFINDGQKEIAFKNEILQAVGTMSVVGGQADYSFPADLLTLNTMYYDNQIVKFMKGTDYDNFIRDTDPQTTNSGKPLVYTRWASSFTLYPKPSEDLADGLKIRYTRRPTDVTSLTDELSLPLEYHSVLVDYCLQQAYETDENVEMTAMKSQQVQTGIDELKELETFKDREMFPTVSVLPEDW